MHGCNDFYVEMLRNKVNSKRFTNPDRKGDNDFLFFSGWIGTGKTSAVLEYCNKYSECLYFSFDNTEPSLALRFFTKKYPHIFSECTDWKTFFSQLFDFVGNKSYTVFFDSYFLKKDSEFFTELLSAHCNISHYTVFVFIEDMFNNHLFTPLHIAEIKKLFPSLTDEEIVLIKAVTGGISSLVALYNPELSFEENLKQFLCPSSYYFQLAEKIIKEYYRTPESYNTLLYGISIGKKRVSELSELSGYPNNKCDKYLKALIKNGLVKHVEARGKQKAYYEITNEYFSLWYRYIFPKHNLDSEAAFENVMKYIKNILVKRTFRKECEYWLLHNAYADTFLGNYRRYNEGIFHYNARLKKVSFDIVYENYGEYLFIKYFDTIGEHCTKKYWAEIEQVTTKFSRMNNNDYILFSIHRFSDYCWEMSAKYDNLRLVQLTAFTPQYTTDNYRLPID